MLKRVFLFVVTNLLVVMTLSLIARVFGIDAYLQSRGGQWLPLALFCLFFGMGGSLISLFLSKTMAIRGMGVRLIDPQRASFSERSLYERVQELSTKAGLPKTPDVGIFSSPEMNAFATGYSKSKALVAVSTGLLDGMDEDELEGVLAHEIAHIQNGDMVTMCLLQGVVNAFVMFIARMIASVLTQGQRDQRRSFGGSYFLIVMILEPILMLLGSLVIFWFSRQREFRADAGGAQYASKTSMIAALERLRSMQSIQDPRRQERAQFSAFMIHHKGMFRHLFATHPPLEDRIAQLKSSK